MHRSFLHDRRGMTFIELLIGAAVILLFFTGLMVTFQLVVSLMGHTKAQSGALALANERMEEIRSFAYTDVGTQGGIPSGPIPQNATTTLNGVEYTERVFIRYVDAPEDGLGASDSNGIVSDYKQVKVEYSWEMRGDNRSLSLITNIVPKGIETTAGGGTLTINVFDAEVQPVDNAEVRVYNDTTTSTIDVTTFTNADGVAMFAGAPAAANYEIVTTKTDYSTDQTYTASSTNPNPNTTPVAVVAGDVSTMNFQIDELSDLTIFTHGPPNTNTFTDSFTTTADVSATSSVVVSGGEVILEGGAGAYAATGTIRSRTVSPGSFTSWETLAVAATGTASTHVAVQVYEVTGTSTYTRIPDTDLPGNAAGFGAGVVDISGLDPSTYPELALEATLTTSDVDETPVLDEWSLSHVVDKPPIGNVTFTMRGDKEIGTASGTPVYKYDAQHTTDGGGELTLSDIEWDLYSITPTGGYDVSRACAELPYSLDPGVDETLTLELVSAVTHSLRVRVEDTNGTAIPGATVDISRSGFSDSATTGICGQVFFNSGLSAATDYQLDVSATGYTDETVSNVAVDGASTVSVTLN